MNKDFAEQFAHEWVEAWNSHDLDAILAHYADDFVMNSPIIQQLAEKTDGSLAGKEAVRAYWARALEMLSDLHFELLNVCCGVDSIVIVYEGHRGVSAEMFQFGADQKVIKAYAHYA